MKYVILAIVVLIVIAIVVLYFIRKKRAIRLVKCTPDLEKLMYIDAALEPFGFAFDLNCDIVVTKNDTLQRNLGYTDLYDFHAPFFGMVMDSEPLYFDYDGKRYRIELWKGQYGITTGAEIGIYIHDHNCLPGFYRAANDDERLNMRFLLSKKCDLFTRCGRSWWLAGFDVGAFSKPKNLKMTVCIELSNCEMCRAFVSALIEKGYSCCQMNICENTVCFEYCRPGYYKPNHRHSFVKCLAQICNFINCHIYMHFTRFFDRTLDKLTYLRFMAPCLYRLIIHLSIPRKRQKAKRRKD